MPEESLAAVAESIRAGKLSPVEAVERCLERVRKWDGRIRAFITLDETNRFAAAWTDRANRVVLISGPKKPGSTPPREADVRKVFGRVGERDLKPWIDRVVDKPLVAKPPQPGTVVSERTVPEVGLTEWTLSNGARVVFKPTDFQNDQILLRGWKPGGRNFSLPHRV